MLICSQISRTFTAAKKTLFVCEYVPVFLLHFSFVTELVIAVIMNSKLISEFQTPVRCQLTWQHALSRGSSFDWPHSCRLIIMYIYLYLNVCLLFFAFLLCNYMIFLSSVFQLCHSNAEHMSDFIVLINFYWRGLTLISAWISNHMSSKVWGEVTYPIQNFKWRLWMDQ